MSVFEKAVDAACTKFWGVGWKEDAALQPFEKRRASMRSAIAAFVATLAHERRPGAAAQPTECQSTDAEDRCDGCSCWKLTRAYSS